MILTIDLGSSATKAALWDEGGAVATSRAELVTTHPVPGWSEQDPRDWWNSVVLACRQMDPRDLATVDAVGFSAARETFAAVSASGQPLGPGLVWSDRRAATEAESICASLGGQEQLRQRTGVVVGAGSTVAKVAWLADRDPAALTESRWLLAPRDLVVLTMTGAATTDRTLASRTGFFDIAGEPVAELAGVAGDRLPPVREPEDVAGTVSRGAAAETGIPPGTPVVLGAGDRPCEALGAGASAVEPLVSWGTTSNVAAPVEVAPSPVPLGLSLSAAARGGYLLEGGLSSSGEALGWLAQLTGHELTSLAREASARPPGANGELALPWLNGARAPWWDQGASAALLGITAASQPGDLARAIYEGVATDAARCLEVIGRSLGQPCAIRVAGGAAAMAPWLGILTGVTALAALVPRSPEAAAAGACILAASATGASWDAATLNPVATRRDPEAASVQAYRRLRPRADQCASAVLALGVGPDPGAQETD